MPVTREARIDGDPDESSIPITIDVCECDDRGTREGSIFDHSYGASLLSDEYPPIRSPCNSSRDRES
jgi:hypothetical protein